MVTWIILIVLTALAILTEIDIRLMHHREQGTEQVTS
jgi:hypothetical protein